MQPIKPSMKITLGEYWPKVLKYCTFTCITDRANILSKANFFYYRTGQHGFQLFLRDNLIDFWLLFNKSFYAVGEKKT